MSGRNASKGIEPRNNYRLGGRYCSFRSRQHSYNRFGKVMRARRDLRPWQDTKGS